MPDDFSIVCMDCDAGMEIATKAQAINDGWVEIMADADLPQANHVGLCPDCQTRPGNVARLEWLRSRREPDLFADDGRVTLWE